MSDEVPALLATRQAAATASSAPRRARRFRRDRHGRGTRGPFTPPMIPIAASRGEQFDALVLEAFDRLNAGMPELEDVAVMVEDVPPRERRDGAPDPVPLGRTESAGRGQPAAIVIYRRPIELRTAPGEKRENLVFDTVTELVAELFGVAPADVDPDYGNDS